MNVKVAAVLGVGPGHGAAVARRFAREDFAVALMARKEESVAGVQEEIEGKGGTALPVTADATNPESVEVAFGRVRSELGDPEVFVYNAGAFQMGGILEIPRSSTSASWRTARGRFQHHLQTYPLQGRARAARSGRLSARRGSRLRACRP